MPTGVDGGSEGSLRRPPSTRFDHNSDTCPSRRSPNPGGIPPSVRSENKKKSLLENKLLDVEAKLQAETDEATRELQLMIQSRDNLQAILFFNGRKCCSD